MATNFYWWDEGSVARASSHEGIEIWVWAPDVTHDDFRWMACNQSDRGRPWAKGRGASFDAARDAAIEALRARHPGREFTSER